MRRVPHKILVLWSLLVAVLGAVSLALAATTDSLPADIAFGLIGMIVFTMVGALIEDRRPGNTVGRICLATGVLLLASMIMRMAAEAIDRQPAPLPPIGALLAMASAGTFTLSVLGFLLLWSRFPDGRPAGRLGRFLDGAIALAAIGILLNVLRPGPLRMGWVDPAPNPIGLDVVGQLPLAILAQISSVALIAVLVAGGISLGVRYRGSAPLARAQIRWFLSAIGTSAALWILLAATQLLAIEGDLEFLWTASLLSMLLTPIAIAIAILRYRLYDIDRIISRALSYVAVTAVLATTFVTANLAMGLLVASVTGGSTLAVAASTLLAAALFQPIRRIVQAPIDRRFNRTRVDAERTLAEFGAQARDEVDLLRIRDLVTATAFEVMRPASVALWLRDEDLPRARSR